MPDNVLLEICLDSVESAIAAQDGGAHRVELCDNLAEGGTTPTLAMIEQVRKSISIGLQIMIRPRAGDFVYSASEFEAMKKEIAIAKHLGADGVVFGLLNVDSTVDKNRTKMLVGLAKPMSITFHRAFDVIQEPFKALEDIIDCGVDRLLTSGQQSTASEGVSLIADLVERARSRIIIMPGSGINKNNAGKIIAKTNVREIHVSTGVIDSSTRHNVVDAKNVQNLLMSITTSDT